jgi:hypothetical protein
VPEPKPPTKMKTSELLNHASDLLSVSGSRPDLVTALRDRADQLDSCNAKTVIEDGVITVEGLKNALLKRLPMQVDVVTCACGSRDTAPLMLVSLAPSSKPCPECGSLILLQCQACELFLCAGCVEARAKSYRESKGVDTISQELVTPVGQGN